MAAALHQYDYIFALATLFAFLDAWNIGANDVANSFATSVSSRSLTMKQAVAIASVMEFTGSVAVGSRVSETIRTKIIDPHLYDDHPDVLLLAMMCAIIASSTFLTVATRYGMPVSTTHSIVGGLVGSGVASVGWSKISWGWNGVSQVFGTWVIAPGIAAVISAVLFLITKYFVLTARNAVKHAFLSIPAYTFLTFAALTMLLAWKGVQAQVDLTAAQILISVFTVATGVTILEAIFVLPFLWRRIMHEDWELKWYHMWQGPWLLKRPPPPPPPFGINKVNIKNYYRGHMNTEELRLVRASESLMQAVQSSQNSAELDKSEGFLPSPGALEMAAGLSSAGRAPSQDPSESYVPARPPGPWNNWRVLVWRISRIVFRGVERDVISLQKRNAMVTWNIEDMHARAPRYDNRAEYMYSALQVMTASTASFIHGANDVANAVGPFTSAFLIWKTGKVSSEVPVPIWVLCFGGGAIVLGLMTYGYHVMRNLGNRLTLMSPSRGFCMELGSAITVLMATRLALPVSTTQCIAGATVGVGLVNGDWRAINLQLVGWIYMGWFITVPVTGVISGCLMGIILNAPNWN